MSLAMVLIIWLVVGALLAGMAAAALAAGTAWLTRGVGTGRWRTVVAAGVLPFASLAWLGLVFVVQAVISEAVLQRDPGLGDTWHCPVGAGYQLLMIDVPDRATVYNPKTQGTSGLVSEQADAVFDVVTLQVAGRYLVGGRTRGAATVPAPSTPRPTATSSWTPRPGRRASSQTIPSCRRIWRRSG